MNDKELVSKMANELMQAWFSNAHGIASEPESIELLVAARNFVDGSDDFIDEDAKHFSNLVFSRNIWDNVAEPYRVA